MSVDWKAMENKYYMACARRQPVVVVRGFGSKVWDDKGKEYFDFTSGWAVNNVGHSNAVVSDAIVEQSKTLLQTSNQFYTIPQIQLAQILVENSCLDKIFICNSGAEANEGAVKLARKYGKMHLDGAYEIVTAFNSFHGRTLAMVAATAQPSYQQIFQPIPDGFTYVEYDNISDIKKATSDKTVAIMIEPVQGEGGVNLPSLNYLQEVRQWCDDNNLILIFDEVQTGLGRIGTLFGYQTFGIEPDVITLAKGLGGGVPIGAFMAKEHVSVFQPGDHGSTFGGNALTCAAAFASTKYIIDNDVPNHVAKIGEYLADKLNDVKDRYNCVVDLRGIGLLWAMEFDDDISASLVAACNDVGLLLNPLRPNAVRLMPVLTVTKDEIDQAVERLEIGLTIVDESK